MTATDTLLSARHAVSAGRMARKGLVDAVLIGLVHGFDDLVRADPLLGPVFADRVGTFRPLACAVSENRPRNLPAPRRCLSDRTRRKHRASIHMNIRDSRGHFGRAGLPPQL